MRKLLLLLLLNVSTFYAVLAQSIANYNFSTNATSSLSLDMNSNAIDMSTGTTTAIAASTNSAANSLTNIGFDFWFMGVRHTQFNVTSHGLLGLTTAVNTGNNVSGGTGARIGAFTNGTVGTNMGTHSTGKVHYKLFGSAPNRLLVVEYLNMSINSTSTNADATFQTRLYETSGVIEFVYGNMNITTGGPFTTVKTGISTTSGIHNTIDYSTHTASTSANTNNTLNNGVVTALNSAADGSRRMYRFTPPAMASPLSINFTAITATTTTVGWTDNSIAETNFLVTRALDAGFTTGVVTAIVASTTTAGTGTTYSSIQNSLFPGTTYYYKVEAYSEIVSQPLSGSQATNAAGVKTAVGSGLWSSTTPGAPWADGIVPALSDDVTINDGVTVTIDVAATCNNLTIGQGASGVLEFEALAARTLTVAQNVTIAAGGIFRSNTGGTVTTHVLSLGGNLTNNGTLDFSTNTNTAGAGITFTGIFNNTFTGTGSTTNIRGITINKGSGTITPTSPTVDMSVSNFTVRGLSVDPTGFLTLTNGILKISGTNTVSSVVFLTASYSIASTAGFWLNNSNFTVTGLNGSPTMSGLLRISNGVYNIGTSSGNAMGGATTSQFIVEGGVINVAGRLLVSSAGASFNMSAGTINVTTVGNASSSNAGFGFTSTTSVFTMSGGTINLVQRNTGATIVDYNVATASPTITGGTLNVGTAATATNFNFGIQGAMPNVVVDNTTNNKTANLSGVARVYGNLTINSGATFSGVSSTIIMIGNPTNIGNIINNGTITNTSATGTNRFQFSGTYGAQNYSGSGVFGTATTPYAGLNLDNPAGVTFSSAVIATRVNLFQGSYDGTNVTVGGTTNAPVIQVGGTATVNAGSFSVAPTFNVTAGNITLIYSSALSAVNTGLEIPVSRTASSVTISNSNGVTLLGGNLTITGASGFTLTSGILTTSSANTLILASTVTTIPGGSATSFVSGPLQIQTAATAADISRTFPIGIAGAFRPLSINTFNNNNTPQNYTAEAINGATGGTGDGGINLTSARYYRIQNTANIFSTATARIVLSYGVDDNLGTVATAVVAQSATAGGTYANQGQFANTASTVTSNAATAAISAGGEFFVLANTASLPITWDGGAGTSNWGDANNWNPDGVPIGSSNVNLNLGSATAINVNGSFAVNDLSIGTNVTLNLTSNTLTVNGNYLQTASTIDLGSGTLDIKGNFTRSGGTFTAGTSTTTFTGGTQAINATGAATTFNHVSLSGGTKTFTTGATYAAAGNVNVAADAVLALSAATNTTINIAGDLTYSATTGGTNIGNLTFGLTGTNKTFTAGTGLLLVPNFTVTATGVYTLASNIEMTTGRTLTVTGTLNAGTNVISGAGNFTTSTDGKLGTAQTTGGVNSTVTVSGTKTWSNLSAIVYNANGNQSIDNHPNAFLHTGGSGTKTLGGWFDITGTTNTSPSRIALLVAEGTTFDDNGHTLRFFNATSTTGTEPVVDVRGSYTSQTNGKLIFSGNVWGGGIRAIAGTVFGDINLKYSVSTNNLGLMFASTAGVTGGTGTITFRSLTLDSTAGGTVLLNAGGLSTTNLVINGDVLINPTTATNTGGGFGGVASTIGNVQVKGNISSTSTNITLPIINATGTNTLTLNGTGPQTITLAAANPMIVTGATLQIDNPNGFTLGQALTIGGNLVMSQKTLNTGANNLTLGVAGSASFEAGSVLKVGAGSTVDFASRPVIFKSSASAVAMLDNVEGTLNGATNVTTWRYIPARRAYRILTPGVTTTTTIRTNWQENATTAAPNPNAGFGTHITGTAGTTGNVNVTSGFDETLTGNPSLYTFNNGTQAWVAAANTGTDTLTSGTGYQILVRGDRSISLASNAPTPTNTVLRANGTLSVGNVNPGLAAGNNEWSLVGNPYWSLVDWNTLTKTNLTNTYWIWDPNVSTRGAYTSFTTGTGASGGGAINQFIQPGQAIFVRNSAAAPTLTFSETHKNVTESNVSGTFRTTINTDGRFVIRLTTPSLQAEGRLADAATLVFGSDFKTAIEAKYDAVKFTNPDENLAIKNGTSLLGLDARPLPEGKDTAFLNLSQYRSNNYVMEIEGKEFSSEAQYLEAWLVDSYKNTRTAISKDGKTTYAYTTDGNAASTTAGRFYIVFDNKKVVLPISTNSLEVKLTPNPATEYVQVNYSARDKGKTTIRIIGTNGQTITTVNLGEQQNGQYRVPVSRLASGIYTVEVIVGNDKQTAKLVKQ